MSLVIAGTCVACVAHQPEVVVLGVEESSVLREGTQALVFVEVVNRDHHPLELSHLDYQLAAEPWITSEGSVALTREVAPGSSAVIEIPVRTTARQVRRGEALPFHLDGRLYAHGDVALRSWEVVADGAIRAGRAQTVAVASPVFAEH